LKQINGYTMTSELTSKNAGFCRWGFCRKNGKDYFIKEFLEPVYPSEQNGLSPRTIERKKKICSDFFSRKKAFYDTLSKCRTGNVIVIKSFFRFGSKYYITTEKIQTDHVDHKILHSLEEHKKETLIRSILYSVSAFHRLSIVHADLKPDNIVLKKLKGGFYAAKIIDFDAGFLVGDHLEQDDLHGDFIYLAPEAYLFSIGEAEKVDTKIDIFALGIILHQIWTGNLPKIPSSFRYIFEAVLDEQEVVVSNSIPPELRGMIIRMLSKNPSERPSAEEVLDVYRKRDEKENEPADAEKHEKNKVEETVSNSVSDIVPDSKLKKSKNLEVPTDFD